MSQTQMAEPPAETQADAEEADRVSEIALAIMRGETDLAAINGMTSDELEAVYTLGHGFYTSGKYDDALEVFRFLCMHRHLEPRFWYSMGASSQMLSKPDIAVQAYGMCALLDPMDPQPSLRAGECFLSLGDETSARNALDAAIAAAAAKPAHAKIGERARMMLSKLGGTTAP